MKWVFSYTRRAKISAYWGEQSKPKKGSSVKYIVKTVIISNKVKYRNSVRAYRNCDMIPLE